MLRFLNLILFIIFAFVVIMFAAQNTKMVSVSFLEFKSVMLPISVIVTSSALLGIIITLIYHFYIILKLKRNFKNTKMNKLPDSNDNEKNNK